MRFIVNPTSVSEPAIRQDLQNFINSAPDSAKWQVFFESATGKLIIEWVSGISAFYTFQNIAARRETYLQHALNKGSLIAGSQHLGYSVYRGQNQHLTLTVTPNVTTVLEKFDIVGSIKDQDIVILEDTPVTSGVQIDLNVVVGEKNSEEKTIQTDSRSTFRFTSKNVSEDYRILLNNNEVDFSNRILDMEDDYYAVLTNHFGSVDVMSLNKDSNTYKYEVGDTLKLEFITLKNISFTTSDINFDYGSYVSHETSETFLSAETKDETRVNAPLYHETQAKIRGRRDYLKVFRFLDTSIIDTNHRDVSPAVIELVYIKNDLTILTDTQKASFVSQLSDVRSMGVEPPTMSDPTRAPLKLAMEVTLLNNQGDPVTRIEDIVSTYEKKLEQTLNFKTLESSIEKAETTEGSGIRFIETARIVIDSDDWQVGHGYERGEHVNPTTSNGYVYELSRIIYKTGSTEPSWPTTNGDTIVDGDIVWECQDVDLCVDLYTWSSEEEKVIGDYVVPFIPNGKMYKAVNFANRSFGNDEIQKISFSDIPDAGTWRIHFGSEKTSNLPFNASANDVQSALRGLSSLSEVEVNGDYSSDFTIAFLGADGNKEQPEVEIDDPGSNEVQKIEFSEVPDAGFWGLSFDGEDTALLNYDATANDIKSALGALPNIDEVEVDGDATNGFEVEFKGVNAKSDVPLMSQYVFSDPGEDEEQKIEFDVIPDSGTWRLHFNGEYTSDMPFDAPALTVQSELNSMDGLSGISVSGDYSSGFTVTFNGDDGKQDQPLIEANNTGRNEKQKVLFSTVPDYGTWRLEYDGEQTVDMPFNATTAQIESYLTTLPNISAVSVSGDYNDGILIEFIGADGLKPLNLITSADPGTDEEQKITFSAVPDAGSFTLLFNTQETDPIPYSSGVNEVQKVSFSVIPDSGNFTLIFEGHQTANISHIANASAIKSALEALPNIDLVDVSGDFASGFEVTFRGENQHKDVDEMTVGINTLEDSGVPVVITMSTETEGENQDVSTIKSKLESLSNIDEVDVSGDFSSGFTILFQGESGKQDVNQIVVGTNTLEQSGVPVSTASITTVQGVFPAQNLERLDENITITIQREQGGLIPANSLTAGGGPVVIDVNEQNQGEEPVSSLLKSGISVTVTITEETKGEIPANSLEKLGSPITVTPSTIVDAKSVEPSWPTEIGETVIDGDIVWIAVEFNGTPNYWEPYTVYYQGDYVRPTTDVVDGEGTQLMYQVLTFVGTSSAFEPSWPTVVGNIVIDGNIEWTCRNPDNSPSQLDFDEYYLITQTVTVSS